MFLLLPCPSLPDDVFVHLSLLGSTLLALFPFGDDFFWSFLLVPPTTISASWSPFCCSHPALLLFSCPFPACYCHPLHQSCCLFSLDHFPFLFRPIPNPSPSSILLPHCPARPYRPSSHWMLAPGLVFEFGHSDQAVLLRSQASRQSLLLLHFSAIPCRLPRHDSSPMFSMRVRFVTQPLMYPTPEGISRLPSVL